MGRISFLITQPLKGTQSTDPNRWPGLILSSSTTGLLTKRHSSHYANSPTPIPTQRQPQLLLKLNWCCLTGQVSGVIPDQTRHPKIKPRAFWSRLYTGCLAFLSPSYQHQSPNDNNNTRHRASTSIYLLTFRVHVTTPPQYGRNGMAHTAGASILLWARGVFSGMRSACGVQWAWRITAWLCHTFLVLPSQRNPCTDYKSAK